MQVQIETKEIKLNKAQKHAIKKRIKKLSRICQMFNPDAVSTHLKLDIKPPRNEFWVNLNLSVPNQQMVAKARHKKFSIAVGEVFKKVTSQLRKHRARLRDKDDYAKVAQAKGKK